MGILNDAKSRKQLSALLIQHASKIIVLSFLCGLTWFCLLASDSLNHKTYFSENALLPGLVIREFNPGSSLKRLLESLKEEAKTHSFTTPSSWIQGQFRQLGLDVYNNNFTLAYPFGLQSVYKGNNIYAIMRAPKVASTEALVLSTPYRGFESLHETTFASIVLMIELAKAFRRHSYWSKDIIFLVTEHENIGIQAWLDAYHEVSTSKYITSEKLVGTSGLIQGVVNLELSTERFSHIDVKIEGLNGQLPNLDLFNLVVELCNREMVMTSFQSRFNYYPSNVLNWDSWKHNFKTMLSMVALQATGLPTGGHGLFHRYGIQAVTLLSKFDKDERGGISLTQIGRVVEGISRSLNNLLEKFHQSFFFYLLPSTRTYISIGMYMPPFALLALPVLIKALYLYLSLQPSSTKDVCADYSHINYWVASDVIFVHLVFGSLTYFSTTYVNYIKKYASLSLEDSFYVLHVALLLMWFMMVYSFNSRCRLTIPDLSYKMCLILLSLGGFLYTLALVNISSATLITVLYVPISITLLYHGRFSIIQYLYLLLINPFVFTYLIVLVQSYFADVNAVWWMHFYRAFGGHKKLIVYAIEDLCFFGNWNYRIVTLILMPLWFNLWSLKTSRVV